MNNSSLSGQIYRKQSNLTLATKPSEVQSVSTVRDGVQYTPFGAHASLARARSDDPWGVKEQKEEKLFQPQQTIAEEDSSPSRPQSRRASQVYSISVQEQPTAKQNSTRGVQSVQSLHSIHKLYQLNQAALERTKSSTNCCYRIGRRINADWLFFIKPIGMLMVLEIGICGIAVVCSDFSSIFQAVWKTWFIMFNLSVMACTSAVFLFNVCRLCHGNVRVKTTFMLLEIIYDVMVSMALLMSAVAYLRVSVDPNTSRSYSLSVVIIAGVCGIISSLMFGISAFFTFTARRNYQYNATRPRRRYSTSSFEIDDWDDEEYEHFKMIDRTAAKHMAQPPIPSKRIVRDPNK